MNHGILTELMDLSLTQLLEDRVGLSLGWDLQLTSISHDVAKGMAYLHEHQVLHRDLKPGNVLLKLPGLLAKVADFGASREAAVTGDASMTMSMAGTPVFMAPEVLRQDRYGKEADVWSFGGLLVHMATRRVPYAKLLETMPPYMLMQMVAIGEINPTSDVAALNPDWPVEVEDLAEHSEHSPRCSRRSRGNRRSSSSG